MRFHDQSRGKAIGAWRAGLAALALLLLAAAGPAQAIDYHFPGATMPAGCSGDGGNYACAGIALAAGDTLTVSAPATITLSGTLTTGASSAINAGGAAADLTLVVSGAIKIGANSTVNANVRSSAAMDVGASTSFTGNFSTTTGAVRLGASDIFTGSISTVDGAVNTGDSSSVSGTITTSSTGAVELGASATVGGDINAAGAIMIGAQASATNLTSKAAINVNSKAMVCGLADSIGGGAITLNDQAIVNSVYCSQSQDTSCVINNSSRPMPPTSPTASSCASGSGATAASSAAGAFDCLETTSNAPWSAQARKPLYTKLVSASFSFDIAALKTDGTLESNYVAAGAKTKYVKLELFDDSITPPSCAAYGNPLAAQTVAFAAGASSGAAGRTLSSSVTLGNAYPRLRWRIKECTDSSCGSFSAMAPSCSSDVFSVRPSAVTLRTGATAQAPSAQALPVINAGASFSLGATTSAGSSYTGLLRLDSSKLTAQIPSQTSSVQSGGAVGSFTPVVLTANAGSNMGAMNNAAYGEVGYLYLAPGAFRDDSFSAVDSAVGDCIVSTAADNNLSDTLIGGKYGCSIGNTAAVSLGRFIPNSFSTTITAGTTMACPSGIACASAGLVYSRQPFGLNVSARNLSGDISVNYSGQFAHAVTLGAWDAPGSTTLNNPPANVQGSTLSHASINASSFVQGVAGVNNTAYAFAAAYPAPGASLATPTSIFIRAVDTDGATSAQGAASIEGGVTVVSGRLAVFNNYGSELVALPINVAAQYWSGTRFATSTTDNVSMFQPGDVVLGNCTKNLASGTSCKASLAVASAPLTLTLVNGISRIKMTPAGVGNTGSVEVRIPALPYLPSSTARIAVGLYKAGPVLYLREVY